MRTSERPDILRLMQRATQLTRAFSREIDPHVALVSRLGRHECLVLRSLLLGFDAPGTIADRLAISAPTVARALRNLEREGWAVVEDDPHDRRRRRARATDAGRERHELAMGAAAARFDALHPGVDRDGVRVAADALEALWAQVGHDEGYADDPPGRP